MRRPLASYRQCQRPAWLLWSIVGLLFSGLPSVGFGQDSTSTSKGSSSGATHPQVLDVTFDSIKFDLEVGGEFQRDLLTAEIENLFDKTIRIKGFIRPSFKQTGITKFVFVRDDQACCFGPGAALYDCILVELAEGAKTDFTVRPITVKGEFFFEEFAGPDGNIWAIYRMKNALVE